MSHMLRCQWYDTVLNVHAPREDRSDNTNDSFYKKLEHVSDQFLKYYMKIM